MKSPKISIVIPSYNKVDYIEETLLSIFSQNYKNLEIIIQDGNSTDGSLEIIKKYAKRYPKKVRWESKKDKGQVDAINKGMAKATGDILSFINADDIYEKNALEIVGNTFLQKPDTLWLAGRGAVIDKDGKQIYKVITSYKNNLLKINRYPFLLMVNYFMQPSVFFGKRAFKKFGPFNKTDPEVVEYDFWLKLGKIKMPRVVDKKLSSFRLTNNTISSRLYKKMLSADYSIAKKNTNNSILLLLHKIHNLGRIFIIKFLNFL